MSEWLTDLPSILLLRDYNTRVVVLGATLLGVVRTAQKVDVDVQAYLTWLFERRGTHRHRFGLSASQLTPTAFKKHLAERLATAA